MLPAANQSLSNRNRKGTRAAVLEAILLSESAVRGEIARQANLSEASVSRILSELRVDGMIEESRIAAPYAGGPTSVISVSKDIRVAGFELANDRLSFGVGPLSGAAEYVDRTDVGPRLAQADFELHFDEGIARMREWIDERGIVPRRAALAIPGFLPGRRNPILPWDSKRLAEFLTDRLGDLPVDITNSVVAQAALRRYAGQDPPEEDSHLFLFVGHGVAGTLVHGGGAIDSFRPYEIGHMVIERGGRTCRCGHHGCLEAYVSLGAMSQILGGTELDISAGDSAAIAARVAKTNCGSEIHERLVLLGVAVGNALNLEVTNRVRIGGWPSLLPDMARDAIMQGLGESLLGEASSVQLDFVAPALGADPKAALCFAAHRFVANGAPMVGGLDQAGEAVA